MKTLQIIQIHSRIIFWGLVGMIISLAIMYMFFVSATVRSVVVRQTLSSQVTSLRSSMATLESEYVNASNLVDLKLATSLGFTEVYNPKFISKKHSVSLNSSR